MNNEIILDAHPKIKESMQSLINSLEKELRGAGYLDITIDSRIPKLTVSAKEDMPESILVPVTPHGKQATLTSKEKKMGAPHLYGIKHALFIATVLVERKVLASLRGFEVSLEEQISDKKLRLYVGVNESEDAIVYLLEGPPKYSFVTKRGILAKKVDTEKKEKKKKKAAAE